MGWINFNSPEYAKKQAEDIAHVEEVNAQRALTSGDDEFIISRTTSILTDRRWLTQAGNYVYPEDMGWQYLRNAYKVLIEGRVKRPGCSGRSNKEWIAIFEAEMKRRGMKL